MNPHVLKEYHFLSLIYSTDDKQREALLKSMTMNQYKILVECIYNILYGVYEITPKEKSELSKYQTVIRRITSKELTHEQRKKLLVKNRFLLPHLLRSIIDSIDNGASDDSSSEAEV